MSPFEMTPRGPSFPRSSCLNPLVPPHGSLVTSGLPRGDTAKPSAHPTQPFTVCKTHTHTHTHTHAGSTLSMPWGDGGVFPFIKRVRNGAHGSSEVAF